MARVSSLSRRAIAPTSPTGADRERHCYVLVKGYVHEVVIVLRQTR